MRDWIIGYLLAQDLRGWRGQALMLKSSEELGGGYLATAPSFEAGIKNQGNVGLLDTLQFCVEELSKRAKHDPELFTHTARWLCKSEDPRSFLAELSIAVDKRFEKAKFE